MKLRPGAYARWLTCHLHASVSAVAHRARVDPRDLRRVCHGAPKIVSAGRMPGVYGAHRLTPEQFAWNVKIGWDKKKSFAPIRRDMGVAKNESGKGGGGHPQPAIHDSRFAIPAPLEWLCRSDLCRLVGRCAAAKHGDFSGRIPRACVETASEPSKPTEGKSWRRRR